MLYQLIVNLKHSLIKLLALFVTFVYSDTMGLFLGMPFLLGKFSGVDLFFSQIIKWSVGNEFGIVTFSTNVFFEPNVSEIYFDSSISTFGNFPFAVITFPPTLTSGNVSSASVGNLSKALVSTKSYDSLLID